MSRMPEARWLGENSPRNLMTRHDIVCVHTIVGYAPAHAAHFSVKADGTIQQSRDTRYQSAANLNGNYRVIAIENEDHGPAFGTWSGSNVPRLTEEQVAANAAILAWAHKEHGIPLQLCPDSRPTSRGLAYHRQGIDGNFGGMQFPGRVSGGEVWTEHFGKVCPGDRRIAQLPDILEKAKELVEGDDMSLYGEQILTKLDALHERVNTIAAADRARQKRRFDIVRAKLTDLEDEVADDATKRLVRNVAGEILIEINPETEDPADT